MELSNPKGVKRIAKALTALWLKGASDLQIDSILRRTRTIESLEYQALTWPVSYPYTYGQAMKNAA